MVLQCLLQAAWQRLLFPCPEGQVGELGEAIDVRGGGRPLLVQRLPQGPPVSNPRWSEVPELGAVWGAVVGAYQCHLAMMPADANLGRKYFMNHE